MKLLISTQELVSFSRCLYLSLSLSLSLPLPFDQSYETVERGAKKKGQCHHIQLDISFGVSLSTQSQRFKFQVDHSFSLFPPPEPFPSFCTCPCLPFPTIQCLLSQVCSYSLPSSSQGSSDSSPCIIYIINGGETDKFLLCNTTIAFQRPWLLYLCFKQQRKTQEIQTQDRRSSLERWALQFFIVSFSSSCAFTPVQVNFCRLNNLD